MSPHKKIYLEYFNYTEGDFIGCEVCSAPAVDVHAIKCDGMGGSPSKRTHHINNLMALCRKCHIKYGDLPQYYDFLKEKHHYKMFKP